MSNPHSDLPISNQNEEPAANQTALSPEHQNLQDIGLIPRPECCMSPLRVTPTVFVATHIDSLGIVQNQHAVATWELMRQLLRKKYRDFSAEDNDEIKPGKQKVYTCCFDHIVVSNLIVVT